MKHCDCDWRTWHELSTGIRPQRGADRWIRSRTLDPDAAAAFELHIRFCADCHQAAALQEAVWTALDEWRHTPISPDFDQEVLRANPPGGAARPMVVAGAAARGGMRRSGIVASTATSDASAWASD